MYYNRKKVKKQGVCVYLVFWCVWLLTITMCIHNSHFCYVLVCHRTCILFCSTLKCILYKNSTLRLGKLGCSTCYCILAKRCLLIHSCRSTWRIQTHTPIVPLAFRAGVTWAGRALIFHKGMMLAHFLRVVEEIISIRGVPIRDLK